MCTVCVVCASRLYRFCVGVYRLCSQSLTGDFSGPCVAQIKSSGLPFVPENQNSLIPLQRAYTGYNDKPLHRHTSAQNVKRCWRPLTSPSPDLVSPTPSIVAGGPPAVVAMYCIVNHSSMPVQLPIPGQAWRRQIMASWWQAPGGTLPGACHHSGRRN